MSPQCPLLVPLASCSLLALQSPLSATHLGPSCWTACVIRQNQRDMQALKRESFSYDLTCYFHPFVFAFVFLSEMITSPWFCLTSAFLLSVSTKCNSLFSCSLAYPFPVQTVQLRSYCFKSACWKCHWSLQVIRWCEDLFKRLSPTPAPGGQQFKLLLAKDTPTACLSPLETAA